MGNTHLEPETKEKLLEYGKEYSHKSPSRSVDRLLAEHRELLVTQRENELLHRLFEPYKLDEEGEA
jgi:hypothetical protein